MPIIVGSVAWKLCFGHELYFDSHGCFISRAPSPRCERHPRQFSSFALDQCAPGTSSIVPSTGARFVGARLVFDAGAATRPWKHNKLIAACRMPPTNALVQLEQTCAALKRHISILNCITDDSKVLRMLSQYSRQRVKGGVPVSFAA